MKILYLAEYQYPPQWTDEPQPLVRIIAAESLDAAAKLAPPIGLIGVSELRFSAQRGRQYTMDDILGLEKTP